MAGIAGIARKDALREVGVMLDLINHRGRGGREIVETEVGTVGIVYTTSRGGLRDTLLNKHSATDGGGNGHLASAEASTTGLVLTRDQLGVAPLYWSRLPDGAVCFASEVKALLPVTRRIEEFPPGHRYDGTRLERYYALRRGKELTDSPEVISKSLRTLLEDAVSRQITGRVMGSWLSGGLDSSTLAAIARPKVHTLHTFAAGLPGAPDLQFAREVAEFIGSTHHEVVVTLDDMLSALPTVIYHLESFDALLVRSSITNYAVARLASDFVEEVFSGEAGDELFAGYEPLKSIPEDRLQDELVDITNRLHNTALQRVDRSASAHGTIAHTVFTDPEVVEFAFRIPAGLKIHEGIEKWILRQAMTGALPDRVLTRTKAKFWEGAGVGDLLAAHAGDTITDADFRRERQLPDGGVIHTKEELLYYRFFAEHFGRAEDPKWVGRTKGAPQEN